MDRHSVYVQHDKLLICISLVCYGCSIRALLDMLESYANISQENI